MYGSGNPRRHAFNTGDQAARCVPIVLCYVCKNLIKIGERAAFVSELHALR
jgi:hypothetical protein